MRHELPKTGDVNKCCGRPTIVSRMKVDTRMMSDPPKTSDRYVHILHWQCDVYESHHGEVWTTSNEKNIKHVNIFEENNEDQ